MGTRACAPNSLLMTPFQALVPKAKMGQTKSMTESLCNEDPLGVEQAKAEQIYRQTELWKHPWTFQGGGEREKKRGQSTDNA